MKNLSLVCEKELVTAEHTKLINLVDLYERTIEEICYSWNNMKSIIINAFNKQYLSELKVNSLLNKNSYYGRGCQLLLMKIIDRYSLIYNKAVLSLSEMGYETILFENELSFVSNKPYTNQNITFEERFDLLSVNDC